MTCPPAGPLLAVLEKSRDSDYIGEPVSQLEHALQAAHFAARAGAEEAEILAALFHDIGHLVAERGAARMADLGVVCHERLGADYLRRAGMPEGVAALVEGHVEAKRYLVSTNAEYRARLSEASRGTLEFQGGPMSGEEAARFEADPLFRAKLRLRTFDERAKLPGLACAGLEDYRPMIERALREGS